MIHSRRALEGYLLIDHTDSPGVTVAECLAAGVHPSHAIQHGQKHEAPTISCTHCQRVVILNPLRTRERHNCPYCDHYVCDDPACVAMAEGRVPHRPLRQVMDELQNAAAKGGELLLTGA